MSPKGQKYLGLAILAWGGTFIYQVPLLRYILYEPMREALSLNHSEFGNLQAWYGYLSAACHFPGGWLADRISPRKLLSFSFFTTALLSFWFATFPGYDVLVVIHALWGVTTTLTFWAAMVRACKDMAGSTEQGKFFGVLEGGRGVTNLIGTTLALLAFDLMADQVAGVRAAILVKALGCLVAAVMTWFFFKDPVELKPSPSLLKDVVATMKSPLVWALSLIVFCGHASFTIGSYMTPYLTEVSGFTAAAAGFAATAWLYVGQIAAAPVSGVLSDKFGRLLFMGYCFALMALLCLVMVLLPGNPEAAVLTVMTFVFFFLAVYAVRGVYFSGMEDLRIPASMAGSAVGMASVIGFTPEFVTFKIAGPLLDKYPGAQGYKYLFTAGVIVAAVGLAVCLVVLAAVNRRKKEAAAA
ncbi:MAG: MFS transporter [Deltaproteobacteria bacterium]|jgi:predicted MFS family arabinose efflux permease|nr:MFS transporter [Deltaproteobacteria bacterium]